MKTPLVLVNFKTYETAVGSKAVELAQLCEKISQETGANIAVAICALDLAAVTAAVSIPVFAQHIDAVEYGSHTGSITPTAVKAAGVSGTLLNHSEKRLGEALPAAVEAAQKAGLTTILCAENAEEAGKLASLNPDFIAIEPPELIGSAEASVTTANPEVITDAIAKVGPVPLLVGAGVKTSTDVAIALKLGAKGVLLASHVMKATDPEKVLRELVADLT